MTYQLGIRVDDLLDTLSGKCFLAETPLDVVENFSVCWIGLVQYILELEVCRTQTIAEVLGKYPATVCSDSKSVAENRVSSYHLHAYVASWTACPDSTP